VTMQITLDRAILAMLLKRAASAARRVGYIDDGVDGALAIGSLADDIDAIVHELSELLGNPHLIAAPLSSGNLTFAPDVVMQDELAIAVTGGAQ
jgi:hypothetical protein